MAGTPENKPAPRNWRFALVIGLSIGVALPLSQGVTQALEPDLGHWGAFLLSVVVAGIGGGLMALLAYWLLHRGGSGPASPRFDAIAEARERRIDVVRQEDCSIQPERNWKLRGCLLVALLLASPFLVIGALAFAGLAFGAFAASLPFLLILAGIAIVSATLVGVVLLVVRVIPRRWIGKD